MVRGRVVSPVVVVPVLAALLAACSGEVELDQPEPPASVAPDCVRVMAALPEEVMGQHRTMVDGNIATWGDPRISVRCGVTKPEKLTRSSRCDELNGIGWFTEDPGTAVDKAWRFTTIGRSGFVEVIVPESYEPAGDVLMDLSAAVKKMPVVTPCA